MANPEHVALVRKGAEAIAAWRKAHPKERLDLRDTQLHGADLHRADLSGADLTGAFLVGAQLGEANLARADLKWAHLTGADLTRAKLPNALLVLAGLIRANLTDANLTKADLANAQLEGTNLTRARLEGADFSFASLFGAELRDADMRNANLTGANLSGATLLGCRLSGARMMLASLTGIDLSEAEGLADVRHLGPSGVGVETLVASFRGAGGQFTPELTSFFRGAGVAEEVLDALPEIVSDIKYFSCFISYGQPNLRFAEKLREDLKRRGVDCWLYEKDKTVGERSGHEIVIERRGAEKMVVLCSAKALTRDRFLEEIEDQINEDPNKMVPISLDDLWKEPGFRVMRGTRDLKPFLLDKNYADFANKPYEEALDELLKGLRRPGAKNTRQSKKPS